MMMMKPIIWLLQYFYWSYLGLFWGFIVDCFFILVAILISKIEDINQKNDKNIQFSARRWSIFDDKTIWIHSFCTKHLQNYCSKLYWHCVKKSKRKVIILQHFIEERNVSQSHRFNIFHFIIFLWNFSFVWHCRCCTIFIHFLQ